MHHSVPLAYVRSPRFAISINGQRIDSLLSLTMSETASYTAGRFDLVVHVRDNADYTSWLSNDFGTARVVIESPADGAGGAEPFFMGLADQVSFDPIRRQARVSGRDYSAVFATSAPAVSFVNQTASEIVAYIANRQGLSSICTETTGIVGSYRDGGYNQLLFSAHSPFKNSWDLLCYLAISEDFELFMRGSTLIFSPLSALNKATWAIAATDTLGIRARKVCMPASRLQVGVRSWNSDLGRVLSSTIDDIGSGGEDTDPSFLTHLVVRPNMTPDGVEKMASRLRSWLLRHRTSLFFIMPGDTLIRARDTIAITGAGEGYDMNYMVRSIQRRFSPLSGFTQSIAASPLLSGDGFALFSGGV